MKTGIELIAEERQRQINNGYDSNHDLQHDFRELTDAAKEALADYYDNAELFVDLAEMLYARVY